MSAHIRLLNCTKCDDIVRIDEDHARACLCGESIAVFAHNSFGGTWVFTGPCRILRIRFEEYDGAAPGVTKKWDIEPK